MSDTPKPFTFDTAPVIGTTDGLRVYCLACARPDDEPVHADSDPECPPPVCSKCGAELRPAAQGGGQAT